MAPDAFREALERFCREALGPGRLEELQRLSGGANMESWSLRHGDERLVLRRLPGGAVPTAAGEALEGIDLAAQATLIEAARAAGVSAPAVRARLEPRHGLGEGFLMTRVEGETLPHRILGKPAFAEAQAALTAQCARELACIHSLDTTRLPLTLARTDPADAVLGLERRYRAWDAELPAFDFVFGWLERNLPAPVEPVVLHGDFRMGNLMIDARGIVAVLDWELAHLGDPAQDLAYLCAPSWRFGHYDAPVGGFGRIEDLLAAYRAEGGAAIEPARFRWWLVYGTLWWGIICLSMGQMWRSRGDRSLERAVVGRRVSEVEIDLLLLFDDAAAPRLDWQLPVEPAPLGETTCDELLTATQEWLQSAVQPALEGRALFEARVAANAIGIARRQAAFGARQAQAAAARLAALGHDGASLCAALRSGEAGLDDPGVRDHLRLRALERLAVDQPGYAGLRHALGSWARSGSVT